MDTLGYLVGYTIAKDNNVTMYTWEIKDLLLVLSNKGGSMLIMYKSGNIL